MNSTLNVGPRSPLGLSFRFSHSLCDTNFVPPPVPGWRNWQTQRTQNPPRFTPRGGSTPPPGTIKSKTYNRRRPFVVQIPRQEVTAVSLSNSPIFAQVSEFHAYSILLAFFAIELDCLLEGRLLFRVLQIVRSFLSVLKRGLDSCALVLVAVAHVLARWVHKPQRIVSSVWIHVPLHS
jgi:hypothetical protein